MAEPIANARNRRVIVAVPGFGDLRPLFREAARIAASLGADLAALLVEDENVRRMTAFPFVDQVSFATARRVPLEAEALDRELGAFARIAERVFAEVVREAGVTGRLQTARGEVAAELRAVASPGDLVVICGAGTFGMAAGSRRLAASALVELCDCDLLLQDLRPGATARINVCDDGSPAAARAIDIAASLARTYGSRLTVIDVDHHSRQLPPRTEVLRTNAGTLAAIRSILQAQAPSILVLPAAVAEQIGALPLVGTAGCAVMVVR